MDLVKHYEKDHTMSLAILDKDGNEIKRLENLPLNSSKGLLVVTVDQEQLTQQHGEQIYQELRSVLASRDNIGAIIIPSSVQIDYLKF